MCFPDPLFRKGKACQGGRAEASALGGPRRGVHPTPGRADPSAVASPKAGKGALRWRNPLRQLHPSDRPTLSALRAAPERGDSAPADARALPAESRRVFASAALPRRAPPPEPGPLAESAVVHALGKRSRNPSPRRAIARAAP